MAEDGNQVEMEVHKEEPTVINETTKNEKVRKARNHKHRTKMNTMALSTGSCIELCCKCIYLSICCCLCKFKDTF